MFTALYKLQRAYLNHTKTLSDNGAGVRMTFLMPLPFGSNFQCSGHELSSLRSEVFVVFFFFLNQIWDIGSDKEWSCVNFHAKLYKVYI